MAFCANCGNEIKEGAKFCTVCGSPVEEQLQQETTQRKQVFEGEIRKCPNCGNPLKSFELVCPSCGLEIRGIGATSSVKQFAQKLEEIENHREYEKPKLFKTAYALERIPKADEQKISLIKSFSVPNTIEDILEFMILASTNIDLSVYAKRDRTYDKARKAVADAWYSKLEQVYIKAKNSFGNEESFQKVEEIYTDCKNRIQKQKKTRMIKWCLIIGWIPIVIVLIIFEMSVCVPTWDKEEEQRLQTIVAEVKDYLNQNNFKTALRRAETIRFERDNKEKEEEWNVKKEDLIDKIIEEAKKHGVKLKRSVNAEKGDNENSGGFFEGIRDGYNNAIKDSD